MRLIDADALRNEWLDKAGKFEPNDVLDSIDYAPTIDAVEVVRCNQCKHYEGVHDVPGCAPCAFWGIGEVMWDDFCKRGERND